MLAFFVHQLRSKNKEALAKKHALQQNLAQYEGGLSTLAPAGAVNISQSMAKLLGDKRKLQAVNDKMQVVSDRLMAEGGGTTGVAEGGEFNPQSARGV
jgi:hypothetical protein